MMLAALLRGDAEMGTVLSRHGITELPQRLGQFLPGEVARGFHRASTSSRTKWRRMILGASSGRSK